MFYELPPSDVELYMDALKLGLAVLDPASDSFIQVKFDDVEVALAEQCTDTEFSINAYAIQRDDIKFQDKKNQEIAVLDKVETVVIHFRGSKFDQFGEGTSRVLARSGCKWCCPVLAAWFLVNHHKAIGAQANSSTLQDRQKSIVTAIKAAATLTGQDPQSYSSQSLRSGGPTALFNAGFDSLAVKLFGRGKSDAVERYIRISGQLTSCMANEMMLKPSLQHSGGLGVKIALAFLIVCTTRSSAGLRGGLICALYIFVVIFTVRGKPFTDPMNNVQKISLKVAAFSTCFCAAVIVGPNSLRGWGGLAVFVQVLNLSVMASVLICGMKRTRLWIKDKTGFLSFSDTSRGIEDARAVDIVPEWNPDKDVKHRVWQAFWRATLLELTEPKLGKDYFGVKIANRLADLEQAVVASGAHRVVSHWKGEEDPYTVRLRQAVLEILEGDVFWGDLDGPRNGRSGFGKMYVKPYPFHCVIVYDDQVKSAVGDTETVGGEASKDVITLRDDYDPSVSTSTHRNLAKLFFLNFSPRIIARRETERDWMQGINKLRSQDQQYRRRLAEKNRRGNETLSDGFWHEVYNKPHLSRNKLEHHLKTREINPQLRELVKTHADALDALYLRMRYIYSHPAVTFWYVFWDDVYARNGEMKKLQDHKALLNPLERTSLCYRVMKRDEVEACLEARQLLGRKGYFVPRLLQLRLELVHPTKVHLPQGLFEPKVLDLLYDTLYKHIDAAKQGKTAQKLKTKTTKNENRWVYVVNKIKRVWLSTQVSHRGRYSLERLLALDEYIQRTSWKDVLLVCVATPLPVILLVLSQEAVPLQDPADGWRVNYGIWIRGSIVAGVVAHTIIIQLQYLVDGVVVSVQRVIAIIFTIMIV
ncbi:unnamed protein product [Phytophthora lilii]|uniref:Unnamed protein product n=1 Tax=Phytophthora lilii TaxID=2077276 RepID=A0A9W6TQQ0_9STRA|nr:unnamed protein product [Phytophthora lilii]